MIFVEGKYYNLENFDDRDISFFKDKELITIIGNKFKLGFVGNMNTPYKNHFSLPKNFTPSEENVDLFKDVIKKYSKINGKSLITNFEFSRASHTW